MRWPSASWRRAGRRPFACAVSGARSFRHPFDLARFYALHCEHCDACRERSAFETAVLNGGNAANPCYVRVLIVMLGGQWRLPLEREPPVFERKDGNYPSFVAACRLCPGTVKPVLAELKSTVLRLVRSDETPPSLISPLLVVLKELDVLVALDKLRRLGFPSKFDLRLGDPAAEEHHLAFQVSLLFLFWFLIYLGPSDFQTFANN